MNPLIDNVPEIPLGIIAVVFLLIGGLMSAADAALQRITRTEAAEAYTSGKRGGDRIIDIVARRPAVAAGIAIVRSIADIVAASCFTMFFAALLHEWWQVILAAVAAGIVVVVLIGLASPRAWGGRYPVEVLGFLSVPLRAFGTIFTPLMRKPTQPANGEEDTTQQDQLAVMVERVAESEALEEDERQLLQSVFELGRTLTREVMVPRTDMITISAEHNLDKALSLFTRSGFSRVPVIGESTDDILGILYLKDVLRRGHHRLDADRLRVRDVMRDPVFVPETKVVDELLRDMQSTYFHMALAVDEYGGIAGLVTLEDLLEELVGEMVDEHDRAEPEVEQLDTHVFRVPARLPIDDLGELFGLSLNDDDVDTVAGLFAKALGRVPIAGAKTDVMGLHLESDRFQGRRRRISTIIASLAADHEELEESDATHD